MGQDWPAPKGAHPRGIRLNGAQNIRTLRTVSRGSFCYLPLGVPALRVFNRQVDNFCQSSARNRLTWFSHRTKRADKIVKGRCLALMPAQDNALNAFGFFGVIHVGLVRCFNNWRRLHVLDRILCRLAYALPITALGWHQLDRVPVTVTGAGHYRQLAACSRRQFRDLVV